MKKSNSLLLSLLCISLIVACNGGGSSSAASTLSPAQQYANAITTEINSLFSNSSGSVMNIAFANNDPSAYIWYASSVSQQQLVSFINNQWSTGYTTSSATFVPDSMALSNNGTLYLGGATGMTYNNPEIFSFANGALNNIAIPNNLQQQGVINSIAVESNNTLYAALESTILVLSNNSWSTISPPSQLYVNGLIIDSNNNLYMLGSNFSLYKYVNNSWIQISTPTTNNSTYLTGAAFNHGTFYLLYDDVGGINGAIYGSPLAGLNESSPNNWSLLIESQLQGDVSFNGNIKADYYGNVYVDIMSNGSGAGQFLDEYFLALPSASN